MVADTVETLLKQPGPTLSSGSRGAKPPSLELIRLQVNKALQSCVDVVRDQFVSSRATWIVEEIERVINAGGSRIRPLLCCCGYAAVGGEGGAADNRIIQAASSLELLHTFAILHDDVMDGSPMRRGGKSTHRQAAVEHQTNRGLRDSERYGYSMAVLAGDLALVVSDLLFARSGFDSALVLEAADPLGRMRLDAIAGQYLDLTHSGEPSGDQEVPARIAQLKTGSYSVRGPLLIGATLGEGSDRAKAALSSYADPLGKAFQYADDIMGLLGDPSATGKDAENDLRQGRPTSLIARALALASPDTGQTIRSIWGKPTATHDEISHLRLAVRQSGAVASLAGSIRMLVTEAKSSLETPAEKDLDPEACRLLALLAEGVLARADDSWSKG
jgi:geranylgeranyl diphosphate synthase type I